MINLNKKGFTLIEIIAVIIILGIIMIIAVPNVSNIIIEQRKETYIINANRFVDAARNFVNSEAIKMDSPTTTYYIPRECLSVDKANKSPYGEWNQVFVVVTYDGTSYDYYFSANDVTKMGIELTYSEDLKKQRVVPNVEKVDVQRSIGLRNNTLVFTNSCKEQDAVRYTATSNIGERESYEGNKSTLIINSVTVEPNDWTNRNVTIIGTAIDPTKGIEGYAISKYKSLDKESSEWVDITNSKTTVTYSKEVEDNALYYFYVKNGDGEIEKKAVSISIIDKEAPYCSILGAGNIQCTDNVGIVGYYFGEVDPRTHEVTYTEIDQTKNFYNTIQTDLSTEKFLIAKDLAGNKSGVVSNKQNLDTTPPECTIVKTMAGYSVGVTVTVLCNDEAGGSGCDTSRNITGERGVKASKVYTIYDRAGNSTSCSVEIEPTQVVAGYACKRPKSEACEVINNDDVTTTITEKRYSFDRIFIDEKKQCDRLGFTWEETNSYTGAGYCYTTYTEYKYSIRRGWRIVTETCSVLNNGSCSQWSSMVRYKANSTLLYNYCYSSSVNNNLEKFVCDVVYY